MVDYLKFYTRTRSENLMAGLVLVPAAIDPMVALRYD
jgi:hypothetical protein